MKIFLRLTLCNTHLTIAPIIFAIEKFKKFTIGIYPSVFPPIIPPVIALKVAKDSESKDKHDAKNQYC